MFSRRLGVWYGQYWGGKTLFLRETHRETFLRESAQTIPSQSGDHRRSLSAMTATSFPHPPNLIHLYSLLAKRESWKMPLPFALNWKRRRLFRSRKLMWVSNDEERYSEMKGNSHYSLDTDGRDRPWRKGAHRHSSCDTYNRWQTQPERRWASQRHQAQLSPDKVLATDEVTTRICMRVKHCECSAVGDGDV